MKIKLYLEENNHLPKQMDSLCGKSCQIMLQTATAPICLEAETEEIYSDSVIVTAPLLDLESMEECIEHIDLFLDGKIFRTNGLEDLSDLERASVGQASNPRFPFQMDNILWNNSFNLGYGVDAVTNMVKESAVKLTKQEKKQELDLDVKIRAFTYSTFNESHTLFSTSMSGSLSVSNIDFGAGLEYLKYVSYSENSLSLVIRADYEEVTWPENEFQLTEDAAKLLNSPMEFRERYGDYYISSLRKGGYLIMIHHCIAESAEKKDQFKSNLSMDAESLGQFALSADFQTLTEECGIRIETRLFCNGCSGFPDNLSTNAPDITKWFNTHKSPVPIYMRFRHYSSLKGAEALPADIPYSSETLQAVKSLYSRFWKLYIDVQQVHNNYKEEINEEFIPIYDSMTGGLSTFVKDQKSREEMKRKMKCLQDKVTDIIRAYVLYRRLKNKKQEEPLPGEDHKQKTNWKEHPTVWEYGCFDFPNVQCMESKNVKAGCFWGQCQKYICNYNNPNYTIVGYRLKSNWTDGTNGDWWKTGKEGLLDHKLNFRIDSYCSRGHDWTYEIYAVENRHIRFDG